MVGNSDLVRNSSNMLITMWGGTGKARYYNAQPKEDTSSTVGGCLKDFDQIIISESCSCIDISKFCILERESSSWNYLPIGNAKGLG